MKQIKIFSGRSHLQLAKETCQKLQIPLSSLAVKEYGSGCFEVIFEQSVSNNTVFLVQTSLPDPDCLEKHIWELFEMISFAKSCGAAEVIVVMPYASYSRSDRIHTEGMGIAAELFVKLLECSGMTGFMGIDFHSERFKNFFSCKVYHLSALDLLAKTLKERNLENTLVLAADKAALKKGSILAQKLGVEFGRVEKKRISNTEVRIENIIGIGDFAQKQVIIFDDEIATGGTLKTLAEEVIKQGAKNIIFAVTHGLFVGDAVKSFQNIEKLTEIILTNTIPIKEQVKESLPLTILSVSNLLAEKIKEI